MTTEATLRDLERTAALLEGRLSGTERDAAIARIEADEGSREVFADLVRFRAASAAETASAPQPLPAPHPWGWRRFVPLAAAAAIATVVLLPQREGWTRPLNVDRLTPAIDSATLSLGDRWYEHQWAGYRGGNRFPGTGPDPCLGKSSPETAGNASFRLGVRLQELATAIAAGRRDDARTVGYRLCGSVRRLKGMQPQAGELRSVIEDPGGATQRRALLRRLASVDRDIARHGNVDPAAFALGKWAAAGYLAAKGGVAHAIPAAPDELLQQAERLSRSDDERHRALGHLKDALRSEHSSAGRSELAAAFAGWIERF